MIFIWIPKCGGTSIFSQQNGMKLYLNNYHEFDNTGDVCFGHADVRELIKRKIITKEYWQNNKAFAVVRNPYHRFISLYFNRLKSGRLDPHVSMKNYAASVLPNVTRKPGLYNVKDFSQASSQVEWLFEGVEIRRFENLTGLPHLNKSTEGKHMEYYDTELLRLVTDLYYDDLTILNYPIIT